MASGLIVKHFDVIRDISSGKIACFVDTFLDALFLQATPSEPDPTQAGAACPRLAAATGDGAARDNVRPCRVK